MSQHNLIVGDSGIGKTTLFRLISGQDKAYSGKSFLKALMEGSYSNLDNCNYSSKSLCLSYKCAT
ncbi:MAG: ATP-binding cassette domain-containing protein [Streptococcus salivarius]